MDVGKAGAEHSRQDEKPTDVLDRAKKCQENGQLKEALQSYGRAVQLLAIRPAEIPTKQAADIYFSRGTLYEWLGKYDQALADFETCLRLNPRKMEANLFRAIIFEKLEKSDEALEAYTQAINIEPHHDALNLRAVFYHKLKLFKEALADSTRVLMVDVKNPFAWIIRGDTHKYMGSQQEALQDYSKALELDANGARRWIGKGFKFERMSEFNEIINQYVTCIRIKPKIGAVPENVDISGWVGEPTIEQVHKSPSKGAIGSPMDSHTVEQPPRNTSKSRIDYTKRSLYSKSRMSDQQSEAASQVTKKEGADPSTGRTYGSRITIISSRLHWDTSRNYRRPWAEVLTSGKPRRPPSAPFLRDHTRDYESIRKRLRPKSMPVRPPGNPRAKATFRRGFLQSGRTPSPMNSIASNTQSLNQSRQQPTGKSFSRSTTQSLSTSQSTNAQRSQTTDKKRPPINQSRSNSTGAPNRQASNLVRESNPSGNSPHAGRLGASLTNKSVLSRTGGSRRSSTTRTSSVMSGRNSSVSNHVTTRSINTRTESKSPASYHPARVSNSVARPPPAITNLRSSSVPNRTGAAKDVNRVESTIQMTKPKAPAKDAPSFPRTINRQPAQTTPPRKIRSNQPNATTSESESKEIHERRFVSNRSNGSFSAKKTEPQQQQSTLQQRGKVATHLPNKAESNNIPSSTVSVVPSLQSMLKSPSGTNHDAVSLSPSASTISLGSSMQTTQPLIQRQLPSARALSLDPLTSPHSSTADSSATPSSRDSNCLFLTDNRVKPAAQGQAGSAASKLAQKKREGWASASQSSQPTMEYDAETNTALDTNPPLDRHSPLNEEDNIIPRKENESQKDSVREANQKARPYASSSPPPLSPGWNETHARNTSANPMATTVNVHQNAGLDLTSSSNISITSYASETPSSRPTPSIRGRYSQPIFYVPT